MELSIAILVYRCSPLKLVLELLEQARLLEINFEVIVYDDGSEDAWQDQLKKELSPLPEVFLELGEINLGRSAARNILASKTLGRYILMIDGDNRVDSPHFLNDYFRTRKPKSVIVGGRVLMDEALPGCELRWRFAKEREVKSLEQRQKNPFDFFQTNCFLADREVFDKVKFEEDLKTYGYEDNLFGFDLERLGFKVIHIQNPQLHSADDRNLSFLRKSEEAMQSLLWIEKNRPQDARRFKLIRLKNNLAQWKLMGLVVGILNLVISGIESNLDSSGPSLWRFDLFRLQRLLLFDSRKEFD